MRLSLLVLSKFMLEQLRESYKTLSDNESFNVQRVLISSIIIRLVVLDWVNNGGSGSSDARPLRFIASSVILGWISYVGFINKQWLLLVYCWTTKQSFIFNLQVFFIFRSTITLKWIHENLLDLLVLIILFIKFNVRGYLIMMSLRVFLFKAHELGLVSVFLFFRINGKWIVFQHRFRTSVSYVHSCW